MLGAGLNRRHPQSSTLTNTHSHGHSFLFQPLEHFNELERLGPLLGVPITADTNVSQLDVTQVAPTNIKVCRWCLLVFGAVFTPRVEVVAVLPILKVVVLVCSSVGG